MQYLHILTPVVVCTFIYIHIRTRIFIHISTHKYVYLHTYDICYIRCSCVHSCAFVYIHQKIWDGSDWCHQIGIKIGVKTIHWKIFRCRWWIDATGPFIPMFSVNLSLAVSARLCHLRCVCHCDVEGIRHMAQLSHSVELLSINVYTARDPCQTHFATHMKCFSCQTSIASDLHIH